MKKQQNLHSTKDVVLKMKQYYQGDILDYGAGTAKYRSILEEDSKSYTTFDMDDSVDVDVVGDVLDAPFEEESFDTVVSTQVLEHVEKPWVMVSEIYRILRTGGVCVLSAPFIVPYHAHPNDFFRFSKVGMASLFKNEGFEIIECESYGATGIVLLEFLRFRYFNPYEEQKYKTLARNFLYYSNKIVRFLDRNSSKDRIIYTGVYIVARKVKK